jgi:uncharacterized protein YqeY
MLIDEIQKNFVEAFKSHDSFKANLLNMIKSAVQYKVIDLREKQTELTDEMVIQIIQSEIKKRKEAIDLYKKGNRLDLAEKEEKEIILLSIYLPQPLTEDEIRNRIKEFIISTKATSKKDFGAVMKLANQALRGKADGMLIKTIVEELLDEASKEITDNQSR